MGSFNHQNSYLQINNGIFLFQTLKDFCIFLLGATFSNGQQMSLEMLTLLLPGFSTPNFHHNTVGGFAVFEDFAAGRRLRHYNKDHFV